MKYIIKINLLIIFFFSSSFSFHSINFEEGRVKNVCKNLQGKALVYVIFVDSRETSPWTEFDIQSTLDSMKSAVQWIEKKAQENDIMLNIQTDYHIGEEFTTIRKRLPENSVQESIQTPNFEKGVENMNKWADKIAREAGSSLPTIDKDGVPIIEQPRNKERLIAYLRDRHDVESVALLFMLNNYFKEDISIALNTLTTEDVEFAVVSYKYPSEIAHNVLHLYGACDLDESPYRRNKKRIELADQLIPRGIMNDPYGKGLGGLSVSPVTKYLIGWQKDLEKQFNPLLNDGFSIQF